MVGGSEQLLIYLAKVWKGEGCTDCARKAEHEHIGAETPNVLLKVAPSEALEARPDL